MRIIAGRARGHKLIPPATMETRPTLDRVKELCLVQFKCIYQRQ